MKHLGEINGWIAFIERKMGEIWRQYMQVSVITVSP